LATPGNYVLDIYRGDSYRWQFRLWEDVAKTIPVDLDNVIAEAEIRDKPSGTKVTAMVCTVTVPNIIDIHLDAVKSSALTIAKGVWDLQLTYENEDVATVLVGAVNITADVTESGAEEIARRR